MTTVKQIRKGDKMKNLTWNELHDALEKARIELCTCGCLKTWHGWHSPSCPYYEKVSQFWNE